MWRVLIVEDDPQLRDFFTSCIESCDQLNVAANFGTLAEAIDWLNQHAATVDVLLTDLGLPDGSGLEVIRQALAFNPAIEPLVISMFGDEATVLASIEAGALGYIHKDAAPDNVAQTILDMRAGASPISPMIARRLLAKYQSAHQAILVDSPLKPPQATNSGLPLTACPPSSGLLSLRELDVLALISRGFSYKEIATLKILSIHTVQSHIKNIYEKLSVHSKNEAVFEATRLGLLGDRV